MSYTDDTVYRLRDALEQYTEIALAYRNEADKKEELLRLIEQNDLTIPNTDIKVESAKEDIDEISLLLNKCACDYQKKKSELQEIQQENKALEVYLKNNDISTDGLFINLSEL